MTLPLAFPDCLQQPFNQVFFTLLANFEATRNTNAYSYRPCALPDDFDLELGLKERPFTQVKIELFDASKTVA